MQLLKDDEAYEDEAQRALVLARWNSWVRVYYPETGETAWVDLREVGFEVLDAAEPE